MTSHGGRRWAIDCGDDERNGSRERADRAIHRSRNYVKINYGGCICDRLELGGVFLSVLMATESIGQVRLMANRIICLSCEQPRNDLHRLVPFFSSFFLCVVVSRWCFLGEINKPVSMSSLPAIHRHLTAIFVW
jgi:hypothetical protein